MKVDILKTMKKNYMHGIAILLIVAIVVLGIFLYREKMWYPKCRIDYFIIWVYIKCMPLIQKAKLIPYQQ